MVQNYQGEQAIGVRVAEIWADVLGADAVRPELTFFELQGQSISAVRITARIEDELGVIVDVGVLFEDPDLAAFIDAVEAAAAAAEAA